MRNLLYTCASAFVLLSAHAAYATHVEDPLTLRIQRKGQAITANSTLEAEEKLRKVPSNIDLVPAGEYEQSRAVTLKDMLDYTPGAFTQPKSGEEGRLSIRGSGLSRNFHLRGVNLYQDGIPLNLADGSADFQEIDPLAFSHTEVLKGAAALSLGSTSLGGALNFVTPTGYTASPHSARVEAGSFDTFRGQMSAGNVVEDSDYYASASFLTSNGYREQSNQDNLRFVSNIGHKLNDNTETRFYITFVDVELELAGALTQTQMAADPTQANPASVTGNQQRNFDLYRIANKTTWRGDNTEVNAGVYTMHKRLFHPIFQVIDQDTNDYGLFANSTFFGDIGGHRNELLVGTLLNQGNTVAKRFVNVAGNRGALTADGRDKAKNASIYAENRFYPAGDVSLIAGTQLLYANRKFEDRFLGNGDQSAQKDFYGFSPKIGALWDINERTQLYTNLSKAYEPPTFSELEQALPGVTGFADIDAQKSTTLEVGTRGSWGRIDWDAAIYRAWLKDELLMYSTGPTTSGVINANETIHQGLELGLDTAVATCINDMGDTLRWRVAYAFNDFYFDNDTTFGDNQLPGIPQHYIRSELRYEHPSGYFIAPNTEIVPDGYPIDMSNTRDTAGYVLLGLRAGYDISQDLSLFADARNLTDKTYASTVNVVAVPTAGNMAVYSPGDGRSVYAGVTWRF